MRAARLHEVGGTPRVDEVDEPGGDVLVEVAAVPLNPLDIAIGTGRFYGGTPELPYVIGSEGVGSADGTRVWFRGSATLAERAVVEREKLVEIPDGVDDATASACGIAGVTGWLAVSWRAPVREDDIVLVLGASGTVGSAAVQGAKLLGAKRVVGAARRVDRVTGADAVVSLDGSEEHEPATLIVDTLWGEPLERALAAAAPGVRVVHIGQSAGAAASLQSAWVRSKMTELLGLSLFSVPLDVLARGYRELCEHARDGRVRIETQSHPLDRVGEAWQAQASGSPGGKVVVRIDG